MEPEIHYASTADGVSIAYWAIGDGPALVYFSPMPGHIELEWQFAVTRTTFELLAKRCRLIHFDIRGSGMSQRAGALDDFDLEKSALLDLDAGRTDWASIGSRSSRTGHPGCWP